MPVLALCNPGERVNLAHEYIMLYGIEPHLTYFGETGSHVMEKTFSGFHLQFSDRQKALLIAKITEP